MDKRFRKPELLSPAGSYDIMKAVVHAGADAVYASGNKFGARAYANNFTEEELLASIDYLHLKERKLYLTVNTLLKETEISELYEYLKPLYEAGLDAVIVQDMGVLYFVHENFPELPIHASTQMNITGAYGAQMMLDAGCSRIVTARELSFAEIADIYEKTGAEIESFVHGALCYCYSGQCLLSSMIGGRSGNRGRCAQPCRLPYELIDNNESLLMEEKKRESYLLSPKDLCTVDFIPRLIQSGVYSFKIEGRMKQAEYAAGVTAIYRKYIDQYVNNPDQPYAVSGEDKKILLELGSRCGFTDGYYTRHNGKNMITYQKPSHEKTSQEQIQKMLPKTEEKEKIKGILRLSKGNPANLMLKYQEVQAEVNGEIVQTAMKQPLSKEMILDKMKKTGNTPFIFEELEVEMEQDIFLTVGALNHLRRDGLKELQEKILQKYRRSVSGKTFVINKKKYDQMSSKIPGLRALTETLEQFQIVLKQPEVHRIYLEEFALSREISIQQLKNCVGEAHKAGKECYLALPYIFRMETARWFLEHWQQIEETGVDGYLVRNYEELGFIKKMDVDSLRIQSDYSLYEYSNMAIQGFERLSVSYYTLPVELNLKELKQIDCTNGEMILYGYQPVMMSAQCVYKNTSVCDRKKRACYLKDRYGKLFPVKNQCQDCYNIIYNISPLSLFHHLGEIQSLQPSGFRLSFTIENETEIESILNYYREAVYTGTINKGKYFLDYTNGHFKRGVE